MKHIVVMSLFSIGLTTAMAYAQPTASTTTPDQTSKQATGLVSTQPSQPTQQQNINADRPQQVSTVAVAKTLKDDTLVHLQGQIVRALGKDKYEFRDKTDTLIVDIDKDKWHGTPLIQKAQIGLIGEIDRESDNQVELEVDEVRILPANQ